MVKIPKLDDLKKMGSDLMDSAKTVKLSGVMDKLKTGIESVSKRTTPDVNLGDDPLGKLLQDATSILNELIAANEAEASAIKKMQNKLAEIARIAANYQKAAPSKTPEPDTYKPEDDFK